VFGTANPRTVRSSRSLVRPSAPQQFPRKAQGPIGSRVLSLRRTPPQRHLGCEVEFAAGSNKRWPEAEVRTTQLNYWGDETPPEAMLLTRFLSRLVPAMEEPREDVTRWLESHDARDTPLK
jgi:hypothetical protein